MVCLVNWLGGVGIGFETDEIWINDVGVALSVEVGDGVETLQLLIPVAWLKMRFLIGSGMGQYLLGQYLKKTVSYK